MSYRLVYILLLAALFSLTGCGSKHSGRSAMASAFEKKKHQNKSEDNDLESIRRSGELIIATLSGPETYYEYRGIPMGLQYALAENFASSEGLKIRVEVGKDTTALLKMLHQGEADVLALALPKALIEKENMVSAGASFAKGQRSWGVASQSKNLAKALQEWFSEEIVASVQKSTTERFQQMRTVRRRVQAVYLSRDRGVISIYDALFQRAAATTGWDWRLIAAQCYQESAFDPNARSWAGAQGLMQLMPATARALGVDPSQVYHPETNVEAGARYLKQLQGQFSDIRDGFERIKFVLASYNGGAGHVRDAMALARKYGHNPQRWEEVSPYILGLQEARFYRDPVVKYGYMIGSETESYVRSILERYRAYGGQVAMHPSQVAPLASESSNALSTHLSTTQSSSLAPKRNKYSSGHRILSPDDPNFHQMGN